MFEPAMRKKAKLRMAIDGPSGSGKTYTSLRCAFALGKKLAAIDTEHCSMSKYQGESPDGIVWNWRVCELQHFDPQNYTVAIQTAARFLPDVLIIDSLSHAWEGVGGALEQVEKSSSKNKYTAWKDVTPKHRAMVEAILSFPGHVIVTMRSKMEHVLEPDEKGRMVPRKVGMAPIQRPGTEYEFDIVAEMDWDHTLVITKTRCSAIDGLRIQRPGPDFMVPIIKWLGRWSAPVALVETPAVAEDSSLTPESDGPPVSLGEQLAEELETPPDTSGQARCSAEQIERCKVLVKQLGMPLAAYKKVLAKRGAKETAALTVEQAVDLIAALSAKLSAQEAVKTAANPTKRKIREEDIPY